MIMLNTSIKTLIDSDLIGKANRVQRYASSRLTDPENLAMHSHDVCMTGILLIDRIRFIEPLEEINIGKYLSKAMIHDMEEVSTGDVPRPLKYSSTEVRKSLQSVADIAAADLFTSNFYDSTTWYNLWKTAKECKEGHLLKFVDLLCVLRKSVYEVDTLGNKTMLDVIGNIAVYMKDLYDNREEYLRVFDYQTTRDYLAVCIMECREIAHSILDKYRDSTTRGIHSGDYI